MEINYLVCPGDVTYPFKLFGEGFDAMHVDLSQSVLIVIDFVPCVCKYLH